MKLRIIICTVLLALLGTTWAQNPKWFKKARKTQVTVITYNTQDEIHQGQGFFISEDGTIIAEYDLFKDAVRGTVVDSEGTEHSITKVLGANSLYNVARLSTTNEKNSIQVKTAQTQSVGSIVYIMPLCNNDKKSLCITDTIKNVQEFSDENYPYYTLSKTIDERFAGCPAFNEEGELIGHIQLSASGSDKPSFILGAQYSNSLTIKALDANNADLTAINIPKELPAEESQAVTYLFLMNKQNTQIYEEQINAFIKKYPSNTTGYILLAELKVKQQDYKAAEGIYSLAMNKQTEAEDELHHSYAKLLYQCGLKEKAPSDGWDMEHALKEAEAAYSCNPLPLYTALEGLCLYALKRYEESHDKFIKVTQSNMRSAEYFMYASQCKQMLLAPTEEILALQDSAVNCYSKPYPAEAANYIYLRGKTLASMEKFREAVADMNEFEHLVSGNVTANFCYEREQVEMQCRQFSNALKDIERAVSLEPEEPLYRAEEAVVNYRVGQLNEAIAAAKEAIRLEETFADAHRILGICLRDQGKTTEAKKSLQKAIEYGDTVAQSILDKIK